MRDIKRRKISVKDDLALIMTLVMFALGVILGFLIGKFNILN